MFSNDVAIRVQDVAKHYLMFKRPEDRLKQSIVPKLQRLVGRKPAKYYRDFAALSGVSFEVKRGETVGIIGRNGSGKSTLMSLLQGTLSPTSGTVEVQGRTMALQLGSGFNPEFTGIENVHLNASIMGLKPDEIEQRMPSIIEFASIGDFLYQPVKTYSSGMYSRLAFAVAAHLDADNLLVDEVLAVGDMAFSQKCMRFITSFKSQGTLVLCSHDMNSVKQLCDRVLWLDAGRLRLIGDAKSVCDEYQRTVLLDGDSTAEMKFGGRRIGLGDRPEPARSASAPPPPEKDSREDLIANSTLRNIVKVFEFDEDAAWYGQRLASIRALVIKSPDGRRLPVLSGGEMVVVEIEAVAEGELDKPIIGFVVRNKQGLAIFSDNTHLTYFDKPIPVSAGEVLRARFRFRMPYLKAGDYAISCAIGNGTQKDHVQQHWIDDALTFHVASSHVARGLCGIPMLEIEMSKEEKKIPRVSQA